jgi:prepilin-type N-terminal cleavage/methylation domain-containing protein
MNRKGFSLIEIVVVMALIGITSTIAAVSLSSNDDTLRSYVRDFRFTLEKGKQEAVARNLPVGFAFFDPASFDCNGDGEVNGRDRCSLLFVEQDNVEGFNELEDQELDRLSIPRSVYVTGATGLRFSPFGESRSASMGMTTAVRTDEDRCTSSCLAISYPVRVNHVGGIEIGDKEETCASCSLCDSCS